MTNLNRLAFQLSTFMVLIFCCHWLTLVHSHVHRVCTDPAMVAHLIRVCLKRTLPDDVQVAAWVKDETSPSSSQRVTTTMTTGAHRDEDEEERLGVVDRDGKPGKRSSGKLDRGHVLDQAEVKADGRGVMVQGSKNRDEFDLLRSRQAGVHGMGVEGEESRDLIGSEEAELSRASPSKSVELQSAARMLKLLADTVNERDAETSDIQELVIKLHPPRLSANQKMQLSDQYASGLDKYGAQLAQEHLADQEFPFLDYDPEDLDEPGESSYHPVQHQLDSSNEPLWLEKLHASSYLSHNADERLPSRDVADRLRYERQRPAMDVSSKYHGASPSREYLVHDGQDDLFDVQVEPHVAEDRTSSRMFGQIRGRLWKSLPREKRAPSLRKAASASSWKDSSVDAVKKIILGSDPDYFHVKRVGGEEHGIDVSPGGAIHLTASRIRAKRSYAAALNLLESCCENGCTDSEMYNFCHGI